ncbi:MAG: glycosyltransferase [Tannerellaceae bacterium]|nr:glycosyltransferase [Tannerellaceae bacterium]
MKFSAIIPAYNVDQYLPDCLDSLLCQNIDMEIIIIDDGSSDKTADIAEEYKKENKNLIVIHQSHSGAAVARNRGLEVAKGQYIVFVDSDDWIVKGVLNKLYIVAEENQADMVMGNMFFIIRMKVKVIGILFLPS